MTARVSKRPVDPRRVWDRRARHLADTLRDLDRVVALPDLSDEERRAYVEARREGEARVAEMGARP